MNCEIIDGVNCRVDNIQDGDMVPIGGSAFGDKFSIFVQVDSNKFNDFFQRVVKNAAACEEKDAFKKWADTAAPGFDIGLLAHMYAFNNVFKKVYPNAFQNAKESVSFYDKPQTLSAAVDAGVCTCKEIAILAQLYFQKHTNISTKYIGGELVRSKNQLSGERHSFISVSWKEKDEKGNTKEKEYIYDPANPVKTGERVLPFVSSVDVTPEQRQKFETRIHLPSEDAIKSAFVAARSIYAAWAQHLWYYGFNDPSIDFDTSFIMNPEKQPVVMPVQSRGF